MEHLNASDHARGVCRNETREHYQGAVGRVINAMRTHLDEELSLEDMAGVAYMSPFHLNRVFRWITGVPPCRFLTAIRLEAAKRLLVKTDHSVTDVSLEVGYSSLGTFTRRFTSLVGACPSTFRSLAAREELGASLQGLCSCAGLPDRGISGKAEPGIDGVVETAPGFSGLIFVGLFDTPIPQGKPVACALRASPGPFQLAPVADGDYHLAAAGLEWGSDPLSYLLYERALRGMVEDRTVRVRQGRTLRPVRVALHSPGPFDPPILMTFPILLGDRLGRLRPRLLEAV